MKGFAVNECITMLSANAAPHSLLFESMWPIPQGVSMNSYIVKGDKCAIVDGLCGWDGVPETLMKLLEAESIALESIDYVVINHMEPDHAGWLDAFKALRPQFNIVCSERAVSLLHEYFGITDGIQVVKDGDTLDLGNGVELEFRYIPNVHWPETMATFERRTKTLMPCDLFGGFKSIDAERPYRDQQSDAEFAAFHDELVRYYSNILGAFSHAVNKAVAVTKELNPLTVAPGHGLLWRNDDVAAVQELYQQLVGFSKEPHGERVTVLWSSMYGATEMGVAPIVEALKGAGAAVVDVHNVPEAHISHIIQSVWQSARVVLGFPTYEYKMFPAMYAVLDEVFKKKILNRKGFRFGSYGWSGGAQKELDALCLNSKCGWEFIEPFEFKGRPTEQDIAILQERARTLMQQQ